MSYRIERRHDVLQPASDELVRRVDGNDVVKRWRRLDRKYADAELAIGAVDHLIRHDVNARVVDDENGEIVWEREDQGEG